MKSNEKLKTVISASRRTDIPKFYYQWLQEALKMGEIEVTNPVYRKKSYKVDLSPEAVHSIVLWSKDFENVLKDPRHLDNYHLYFHYTINNYPSLLEPNVPSYAKTMAILEGLRKRYRPEQFSIRFDPVIIAEHRNYGILSSAGSRTKAFKTLCDDLSSLGMEKSRIIISFVTLYGFVEKNLQKKGVLFTNPVVKEQMDIAEEMAEIAEKYNFQVYSCASPVLEQVEGIQKGHCIDAFLLESIFGGRVSKATDSGQREACGCTKSKDIGSYDQECQHGCIYCYQRKFN